MDLKGSSIFRTRPYNIPFQKFIQNKEALNSNDNRAMSRRRETVVSIDSHELSRSE